jgi:predicted branched-subunit amino acid permease
VGIPPFGVIFGVTAAGSSIGGDLGYVSSIVIFAGATQLAMVQLFDVEAAIVTIVVTGLFINARLMMHSAALSPHFRELSPRAKVMIPYLLADQAFAVSINRFQEPTDPTYRRRFFLGAGLALWTTWQISVGAGLLVGAQLPEKWSLDFTIPLAFLGLLAIAVRNKPAAWVAAIVGRAVAVIAQNAPYQLWMIIAATAGVFAAVLTERARS